MPNTPKALNPSNPKSLKPSRSIPDAHQADDGGDSRPPLHAHLHSPTPSCPRPHTGFEPPARVKKAGPLVSAGAALPPLKAQPTEATIHRRGYEPLSV